MTFSLGWLSCNFNSVATISSTFEELLPLISFIKGALLQTLLLEVGAGAKDGKPWLDVACGSGSGTSLLKIWD